MTDSAALTLAWWEERLDADVVPYPALMRWRARIEFTNEFPPGADRERVSVKIADALARLIDCEPSDMPGAVACPDDASALGPWDG